MIWFGSVLWHINHCRLFNAKSFLCIYIKYIWFRLVGFYGRSTIVGYLMPKTFYIVQFETIQFSLNKVFFFVYSLLNLKKSYFKQFSLAYVHSFNVKTSQFQTIQFNKSTQFKCQKHFYFNKVQFFVHTQLNVKTLLCQTIQFSISTQFQCQNSSISNSSL